ncbi:hypothetical protein AB5J55_35395 [Streptomyces sp. R11]|uniref:Uncharacterized protein n=1 Tax=Streptomyces sp. R11 TaxID=3238625 RepID=A0AB39N7V0_9ACTN
MPRIKLAHWVGDHKPGDEIEVSDVELTALKRDGRVAEVVEAPARKPVVVAEATAEAEPAQPEPAGETGRKRR